MKKTESKKLVGSAFDRMFRYVFMPVLFLLAISHLLSIYRLTPFLWGIHFLCFFPRWIGWILTIVTISFFIPPVNSLLLKLFESILSTMRDVFARFKKHALFAIAGLLSIPLFWALRTKLFLLGDGYFKIATVSSGVITLTEPLDGIVHHQFYRFLTSISPGIDPSYSYTILSMVCGGIFVFLILRLSDILGETAFKKVLIFCSLLTLGSIELFFGYVESYTVLLVGLTAFILLSILHIQGRTNIFFSFLALSFSIGVHVSAIVFVSAFFYMLFWKWKKEKGKPLDVFAILSLLGCLAIIFVAVWKVFMMPGEGNKFGQFIPLFASAKTNFTMFGGAHIGEIANQLLLISPVGILLFLFSLFYTVKFKIFENPILNFLLISSLSALLLVFIYNGRWGHSDWDLRSFAGIFFTLFGILLFIKWGSNWTRFKNYGLIFMAVGFFHTIPWILVNADKQKSVDRYTMTSINDKHILSAKGGSMWRIARGLQMAGARKEGDEILKEGIKRDPLELGCYSILAKSLNAQKKYNEAIFYLESALKIKPTSKETRFSLGEIYLKKDDLEKAIFHLEKVKGEYESDSTFMITLATAYMKAHKLEDAKNLMQEFLVKNLESATLRRMLGGIFFVQKDYLNAKREWETALKLNPDEALAKKGMEELRKIGVK